MLLATYQPNRPHKERQKPQYDCFRDKLDGEYPVFCFPARTADEFRFRSLLASPCKPERLVLFETDDYARFDAVVWNNILTLPRDANFAERFGNMFEDVDERFSEYVVSGDNLVEPILSVDLKQLVEDDVVAFDERGGDLTDVVDPILETTREQARSMVRRAMMNGCPRTDERFDVGAILYQTAFVFYLAGVMWCVGTGKACNPVEFIPFIPKPDNLAACDAWMRFNELRDKVFDSVGGGTHSEYIEMCDALAYAVGENRKDFLSTCGRNNLCPCGSGRKLKKCHWKHPFEPFPFHQE